MKYFLLLALKSILASSYLLSSIFTPPKTSLQISSVLSELDPETVFENFPDFTSFKTNQEAIPDLLLVFTSDQITLEQISIYSNHNKLATLVFSPGQSSGYLIHTEASADCLGQSIIRLTRSLKLNNLALIWSYSERNLKIHEVLKDEFHDRIRCISITLNSSVSDLSLSLSKIFKSDGFMYFIFLADSGTCGDLGEAFEMNYMNSVGNVAIFVDDCVFKVGIEGSVFIVQEEKRPGMDEDDYNLFILKKYLSVLSISGLSSEQIFKELKSIENSCEFSVQNTQNNSNQIIGKITPDSLFLSKNPIYFKGVTDLTNYSSAQIIISGNTGTFNPLGVAPTFANQKFHQGTYFAVGKVNRDKVLLPNHLLVLYDKVDCGVNVFDYNYSKSCFIKHRPNMGVAYIPSFFPISMNVNTQLQSLNLSIPMVAGGGSAVPLSNKTVYPYFIRLVSPSSSYASAWANLINIYGWDKVILHNSNDAFGMGIMNVLNSSQKTYKYKIINDQNYWTVNNTYDNSTLPLYYDHIKNSISLGCNIIFLAMSDPTPFFWIEGFYDMGIRRGDLTFIVFTLTGLDAFTSSTANVTKRKELMHGSFVLLNAAWLGDYGLEIKQEYLKYYSNTWARSSFVDSSMTIANTISFLLDQGYPYEDKKVFMKAARNIRFIGTTGTISFDSESNNRNLVYFHLFNFYQDKYGNWHDDTVALISPLGSVYYTLMKDIEWAGGSMPVSMKANYENCPFMESEIQDSKSAVNVKIGVSCSLIFITTCFTFYVLKILKYRKLMMLRVKTFINFQDYVTLGFIYVESLQIISIGPSFAGFNRFLNNLSEILSLNISKVTQFKDTTFWIIFYFMLISSYLWLLLLLISACKWLRLSYKTQNRLNSLKRFSTPFLSNYLFLPIVVSIFSILMCDKASGNQMTDSYLNYDCNEKCWQGEHIVYVFLACLLICLYVPIAILYRTLWQEEDASLNIKTKSAYLITKNISVVCLVIIGKILKDDYEFIHAIIFIVVEFSLFVFIIVIKTPFNYDRANLWTKIMIICVLWNSLVCTLGLSLNIEGYALVILQLMGWVVSCICALIIQHKLPQNLLVSKTGKSVVELFRFAFGIQKYVDSKYLELDQEANDCEVGSRIDS